MARSFEVGVMMTMQGKLDAGEAVTAAHVFALLWNDLVSILGTTAAAALLRHAARRARATAPELHALHIVREGSEYRYTLPASWAEQRPGEVPALIVLVRSELVPILQEFTGQIVVRSLARHRCLQDLGFPSSEQP